MSEYEADHRKADSSMIARDLQLGAQTPLESSLNARAEISESLITLRSYSVFGIRVTPAGPDALVDELRRHLRAANSCVLAYQNMHGLYTVRRDPAVRDLHARRDTIVQIDGMSLVLLCRLAGIPVRRRDRVTWVDFIWLLLGAAASERWRVFYLGGSEEAQRLGLAVIRERLPHLEIEGHHGFFEPAEDTSGAIVAEIRRFAPHILLVGMGIGRQESWILQNISVLGPTCICASGACLEYVAGLVGTPPRWMGRWGLEWLYRLAENPRRFWFRYLVEPYYVLADCTRDRLNKTP